MIVVNGQAFYQSTGKNSQLEATWVPFCMVRGTKEWSSLCSKDRKNKLSGDFLKGLHDADNKNYIIKPEGFYPPKSITKPAGYLNNYYNEESFLTKLGLLNFEKQNLIRQLMNRCLTLDNLEISYRLGGGVFEDQKIKDFVFNNFLQGRNLEPIKVSDTPTQMITDPDQINDWLCDSNSVLARHILRDEELSLPVPQGGGMQYSAT